MFEEREQRLRDLLRSFVSDFSPAGVAQLEEYVDHGEPGLAIEILSDWIYEHDIAVDSRREAAILQCSTDHGIERNYHAFVGRIPPYPDLRTAAQLEESGKRYHPTLENIRAFAKQNKTLIAVKLYRELTGAQLDEATTAVENMTRRST